MLDEHQDMLPGAIRKSMVQALILLKNKNLVAAVDVLPLMFRLFRVQDKALREHLFRHIVSDIKSQNRKHRNEKLNRTLQNFMYQMLADDNVTAAKKSLAVLTELYRRQVWRDARTVNVIASACFHKNSTVMFAALRFFLGLDEAGDDGSEDGEDTPEDKAETAAAMAAGPSKQDLYKAYNLGTMASKKKKQKKLKRVVQTAKKAARRTVGGAQQSFAAIELLHDPQTFTEKLLTRIRSGGEKFETRLALMQLVSRCIGVHTLLVLNFYPLMQKYCLPHQRDVTQILAALVQAIHALVPPETLAPVLRQIVDHFVHDKARPEVMTIGLKTVREMCLRQPLMIEEDLLRDLTQYKKFREKHVGSAARGLISLFRELAPHMLEKKDRGRGHDATRRLEAYGAIVGRGADRVDGVDLLEAALKQGKTVEDIIARDSDDDDSDNSDASGSIEELEGGDDGEEGWEGIELESLSGEEEEEVDDDDKENDDGEEGWEGIELQSLSEGEEDEDESGSGGDDGSGQEEEDDDDDEELPGPPTGGKRAERARKAPPTPAEDSIATLKKRLAEAKAKKEAAENPTTTTARASRKRPSPSEETNNGDRPTHGVTAADEEDRPLEYGRILTDADFAAIRKLKNRQLMAKAAVKHGLKSVKSAAEFEHDEELERLLSMAPERLAERRVTGSDLETAHKRRKTKEERMESVLRGREDRGEFGSSTGRGKRKTGGSSNKEKEKKKIMPVAARIKQITKRKHGRTHGGKVRGGTRKKK